MTGGAPMRFCYAVFQPTEEGGGAPMPPELSEATPVRGLGRAEQSQGRPTS